jgi:transposase
VPGPAACACCGSTRLSKLGEDITETLEVIPRQWKVIQHVREKFTCRACEKISQAPAPFHVIARGRAGPSLLAMILYAKFALHQPLNRQSEAYAREGVDLPLSTLADDVGACAAVLTPLAELIGAQVFAAARIHGDDTPVPLLAKGKTVQARLWTYVRDDRPFGGPDPPAAAHAIAAASAPSGISRTTAAFCRPTPMQASTRSIRTTAPLGRSRRRHVGRMQEGSFSFLQTLQRRPGPISPSSFRRSRSKR